VHDDPAAGPSLQSLSLRRFVRPSAESYESLRAGYEAVHDHWRTRRLAAVTDPAFAAIFRYHNPA